MKTLRVVLTLVLGLCLASPLLAAPKNKKKGQKPKLTTAEKRVDAITKKLTLTTEQTAKLDALKKEYGPKVDDAVKQLKEAKQKLTAVGKGLKDKVLEVLTPEQKEQLKAKKAGAKKAGAKKAGAKKGGKKRAKKQPGVELPTAK